MIANFPAKMAKFNIGDNLQRNSPFFNLKSVKNVENKIENTEINIIPIIDKTINIIPPGLSQKSSG